MVKFKKILILILGLILWLLFFDLCVFAEESKEPLSIYPAGDIHFCGNAYRVVVKNYGQGKIMVVLYPEGKSAKERIEISFYDWQNFVSEVRKVSSIAVREKIKEVLSVKEFFRIKEIIGEEDVKISGIAKGVKITKGLFFYYTLFTLTDGEGNSLKVSLQGKHKIPEGKRIEIEGKYSEYDKEFKARKISW